MTDSIATIRDYLHSPLSKSPPQVVAQALASLEAELTALRESALDLSRVPEGYKFRRLERWREPEMFLCMFAGPNAPGGPHISGAGPTPRAALDAAIARAKEYGETK